MMDELEKGPWPSFVSDIKREALHRRKLGQENLMMPMEACEDLLGIVELSVPEPDSSKGMAWQGSLLSQGSDNEDLDSDTLRSFYFGYAWGYDFLECGAEITPMIEYFKEHDLRKIAKIITKLEKRKKPITYEAIGSRIKLGLKKLNALKNVTKDLEIKRNAELYYEIFSILKRNNSLHHTQSKKLVKKEIQA